MNSFKIKIAETDNELNQVYRLRYQHAYKDKKGADATYALDHRKIYKDSYDNEKAKVIIALNNKNKIIGTVRLLLKKETNFPYDWCYDYNYIASYLAIPLESVYSRCALLDRGCVHPEYRGLGLYWEMLAYLEFLMQNNNVNILMGTWVQTDYQLALSHAHKSKWILPQKQYYNSKREIYYFGFKLV